MPRSLPARDLLLDLAIGAGLTIYLTAATSLDGGNAGWEIARDLAEGLAVACRRVWTLPALAVVMVVTAFNDLATWPYPLGLAIMLYTLAAEGYARHRVWLSAALGALVLLVPWPSTEEITWAVMIYLVPEMLLFSVAPVLFGLYAHELSQRAATNERQRKLEAERVREDERNRLANEIHDVVAHRVSLMVVHTGALKLAATDEKTRRTADLVRSSGRLALEELRELVRVLRSEESPPLQPMASLDKVEALVEEARGAGQEVRFVETGVRRKLPSTVERTAYRVVQESLTNTRKHASGAKVQVRLTWWDSRLEIEVANSPVVVEETGFPEGGHGLRSLRERVGLVSGNFTAGQTSDGGWAVHAFLPYGGGS
ncbi:two-component sensor histidine kinase [Rhizocola hellebori]|uniref:histidine kinase n=1 Tax=Rhizocola hellebori TaxID=1392758 RepID=A0A8J3VEL3_9ACTN|nr:histidine kinase [Rhizocola hellebori]GIH04584.1 two-component sensor histidine kinase [Rhizocola hellebori]